MPLQPVAQPVLRINLRRLIVLVAFASAVISLLNSFHATYQVQRQLLIDTTLEANHAYAQKLASSTENFLQATRQQLAYSARLLPRHFADPAALKAEAERLRGQTNSFNSVLVVNAQGTVLAVSPETLALQNSQLASEGARQALRERRPLITRPYLSSVGNLVVFISHPVFDDAGRYLGYVGGSIYLKQKNILFTLLGQHYYRDGSYLFVVDRSRRLLYHPDPLRVGEVAGDNAVIDAILRQESGSGSTVNSKGTDMLAGYAVLPSTGWGIVAQRPTAATLEPLNQLMLNTLWHSLPIALLSLPFIWWLARLISRPLVQLAEGASRMDAPGMAERIGGIRAWYLEAAQITRALLVGMSLLQQAQALEQGFLDLRRFHVPGTDGADALGRAGIVHAPRALGQLHQGPRNQAGQPPDEWQAEQGNRQRMPQRIGHQLVQRRQGHRRGALRHDAPARRWHDGVAGQHVHAQAVVDAPVAAALPGDDGIDHFIAAGHVAQARGVRVVQQAPLLVHHI